MRLGWKYVVACGVCLLAPGAALVAVDSYLRAARQTAPTKGAEPVTRGVNGGAAPRQMTEAEAEADATVRRFRFGQNNPRFVRTERVKPPEETQLPKSLSSR